MSRRIIFCIFLLFFPQADLLAGESSVDFSRLRQQNVSYYQVLEVEPTATPDEIKRAYRRLLHIYHPDRFHGTNQVYLANQAVQRLYEAYNVLSDSTQRRFYNNTLRRDIPSWHDRYKSSPQPSNARAFDFGPDFDNDPPPRSNSRPPSPSPTSQQGSTTPSSRNLVPTINDSTPNPSSRPNLSLPHPQPTLALPSPAPLSPAPNPAYGQATRRYRENCSQRVLGILVDELL